MQPPAGIDVPMPPVAGLAPPPGLGVTIPPGASAALPPGTRVVLPPGMQVSIPFSKGVSMVPAVPFKPKAKLGTREALLEMANAAVNAMMAAEPALVTL